METDPKEAMKQNQKYPCFLYSTHLTLGKVICMPMHSEPTAALLGADKLD